MNKKLLYGLAIIGLAILLIQNINKANQVVGSNNEPINEVTIRGKKAKTDEAKKALTLIEKNLEAANNEDMNTYLETVVSSAAKDTTKELQPFFDEYDVENTLISFEVKKASDTEMTIETQQRTINKGKKKYRNHIATVLHTLTKEDGEWKIKQSNMTNSEFITE
ncbi:hypothetical protein ACWN8B_06890 [Vagococcus zengguangii]|uniref:DUF4878 domain-containing protein n=1 Tax=Vagococcus zengguangii TaxID=2571750 RepID=A0A4D7CTI7_9ENTE|nr:hypothetical protein [Vagococcus zengguangii]QCI86182.1 hypothetical protein FA707_04040 [Vagococcus zengguangii]